MGESPYSKSMRERMDKIDFYKRDPEGAAKYYAEIDRQREKELKELNERSQEERRVKAAAHNKKYPGGSDFRNILNR